MKYEYNKDYGCVVCEPSSADEWLKLLVEISIDYDGCRTEKGLMGLIDEMSDMAKRARICLNSGEIFSNKEEDEKEWEMARAKELEANQ